MTSLPLAVRIAAGLAATAVERARRLPQDLAELPVTAVSQAMQVSMHVQQRITDLAIKGDNAIAQLRSPAEEPPWAVFDEDIEDSVYRLPDDRTDTGSAEDGVGQTELAREWYDAQYGAGTSDTATEAADTATQAAETATVVPGTATQGADTATGVPGTANAAAAHTADTPGGGPDVLPGYAELSIASVRARLRTLSIDDLQTLLEFELTHDDRPEFVRMLTNRINSVSER